MKQLLFLLLLCVSLLGVGAQDVECDSSLKITGTVTDKETGKPIGGADIRIKDAPFGITSSFNGFFSINDIMPGSVLYVTYPGKDTEIVRILKNCTDYSVELEKDVEDRVYRVVGRMPQFPGGYDAFDSFVGTHLQWDTLEYEKWVFVDMIFKKDGSFEVLDVFCIDNKMKEETLRIIHMMPKWTPGMRRGKPVTVRTKILVKFPGRQPNVEIIDFFDLDGYYDNMSEDGVYGIVKDMPQFPGGMAECMKFVAKNLQYQRESVQARVIVQFIVERDGSISSPKVVRGVNPEWDAEAIRVVKLMPNWIPGKQNGKPVAVEYTLPIMFRIK